jgi:hypothetical protein
MTTDRKTAIIAGTLFIVATAASLVGSGLTDPILGAPDYLNAIASNGSRVIVGALLSFIAAAGSSSIAISLYPLLKNIMRVWLLGPLASGLSRGFSISSVRFACYPCSH